jgi:RNA polymerase sigma factor (sigma-70 family)
MEPLDPIHRRPDGKSADFSTTHWSLVLAAGEERNAQRQTALSQLCQTYWMPLYSYARRRVSDTHEAQDLTQAFFERLLEKNYVGDADPQRGRFRAFLITSFKHFLAKDRDFSQALKRGGGQSIISLDFESGDSHVAMQPSKGLTPDQIFERQWAITLLEHVVRRLEREQDRAGKASQFQLLKNSIISRSERTSNAAMAHELGMTESAARMAASRLRSRYRELLREEIAQTVARPEDIDDEIRHLFATFAS